MNKQLNTLITCTLIITSLFLMTSKAPAQRAQQELRIKHFTLENGMQVYLNQDATQSKVWGAVVVKGGASRDPEDATGIAHYFEHIMFKGTDRIGTVDYSSERVLLDSISQLYEVLRLNPDDEVFRKSMLGKIDELSQKAAKYAIPNEFNQIMEEMGGTGINAYTTYENIVYYNAFPASSMEKWLKVYSHRFQSPVFRLFQSELETVYEEKNMSMDNPFNMLFEEVYAKFYPNSVYGKQTILGSVEHLKNPSLKKMHDYYKRYYVANNMALVISGNFEFSSIERDIETYFGRIRHEEIEPRKKSSEPAFDGRTHFSSRSTPVPIGIMGFRTVEKTHPDALGLSLINQLLTNQESTGLLDQLVKENELMAAQSMQDPHSDIGGSFVIYIPKPVVQSLKKSEKKILDKLDQLKQGDFSKQLFEAVKKSMIKSKLKKMEDSKGKMDIMINMFMDNSTPDDYHMKMEKLQALTKEDIVKLANKYYGKNYFSYYSKMGFPKKTHLDKPNFTPIKTNDEDGKTSSFARELSEMEEISTPVRFLDFSSVNKSDIRYNLHLYQTPNKINNVFSIEIKIGKGLYEEPMLKEVAEYMNQVAPKGKSFEDFRMRIQSLGGSYYFSVSNSKLHLHIEGFDENLEEIVLLLVELVDNPDIDEKAMKKLVQMRKIENQLPKRDVNTKANVVEQYALYGENSFYLRRISLKELKKLEAQDLIDKLHHVMHYETSIHYVGNHEREMLHKVFKNMFKDPKGLASARLPAYVPHREVQENVVYTLYDKKAVQSHIQIVVPSNPIHLDERAVMNTFNKYFGSGMSALVFQEIREFRSLAYASWGYHYAPFRYRNPSVFIGALTTQGDKTPEALDVYTGLLNNMPLKETRMKGISHSLIRSLPTRQPGFRTQSQVIENWKLQGYKQDPRIQQLEFYKNAHFEDIKGFYTYSLQSKKMIISVVGNKKKFDTDELQRFGNVEELKLKQVFKK